MQQSAVSILPNTEETGRLTIVQRLVEESRAALNCQLQCPTLIGQGTQGAPQSSQYAFVPISFRGMAKAGPCSNIRAGELKSLLPLHVLNASLAFPVPRPYCTTAAKANP